MSEQAPNQKFLCYQEIKFEIWKIFITKYIEFI